MVFIKTFYVISTILFIYTSSEEKLKRIECDHLGSIYKIYEDKIEKIDSTGLSACTLNTKENGLIKDSDFHNPQQGIILTDHNKILFTDKNCILSHQPVLLDNFEFYSPTLICSSQHGYFWSYDETLETVFLFGTNLEINAEIKLTPNILKNKHPHKIIENNNKLYILIKNQGIFIFNITGEFTRKIEVGTVSNIAFSKKNLYFNKNDSLFQEEKHTYQHYFSGLTFKGKDFCTNNRYIYLYTQETIERHSINKNQ